MKPSNASMVVLCSCLLAACGGDSTPRPAASRTIEQVNLAAPVHTVRPGWVVNVRLTTVDSNGVLSPAAGPVVWTSSDPSVATVAAPTNPSASTVWGLAPGRVKITATVNGVSGTTEIEVRPDAPYRFASLSAGETHTCAAGIGGPPACWGANAQGQLGNGTVDSSAVPVEVRGISAADTVAAGDGFSCAGSADGVQCWGGNTFGQLGDGTNSDRWKPEPYRFVLELYGDRPPLLSAGQRHACAASAVDDYFSTAETYCWGDNSSGQLGTTTTMTSAFPVWTSSPELVEISAGGQHTCGVSGHTAYCWGSNDAGQLGDGTYQTRTMPTVAARGIAVNRISAGQRHTCAVSTSNDAYCWGDAANGQLGHGSQNGSAVPIAVAGGLKFALVAAGSAHTCGLTVEKAAYCWGSNSHGQLGDGTSTDRSTPVAVAGDLRFDSIVAGGRHTCGLTTDQVAYCWGSNSDGQLGNGTRSDSAVLVRVLQQD